MTRAGLVGWGYVVGSRKVHAFVANRSLCGKWATFVRSEHMEPNQPDLDACTPCARAVVSRDDTSSSAEQPKSAPLGPVSDGAHDF